MGFSFHPAESGTPLASCESIAHKRVRLSKREPHGPDINRHKDFLCVLINRMNHNNIKSGLFRIIAAIQTD